MLAPEPDASILGWSLLAARPERKNQETSTAPATADHGIDIIHWYDDHQQRSYGTFQRLANRNDGQVVGEF